MHVNYLFKPLLHNLAIWQHTVYLDLYGFFKLEKRLFTALLFGEGFPLFVPVINFDEDELHLNFLHSFFLSFFYTKSDVCTFFISFFLICLKETVFLAYQLFGVI